MTLTCIRNSRLGNKHVMLTPFSKHHKPS